MPNHAAAPSGLPKSIIVDESGLVESEKALGLVSHYYNTKFKRTGASASTAKEIEKRLNRGLGFVQKIGVRIARDLNQIVQVKIPGVSKSSIKSGPEDKRRIRSLVVNEERWQAVVNCLAELELGQTVVYAFDREHGQTLARHLRYVGVKTEYVDGNTPFANRYGIFERFRNKETRVLVNVALFIEGVDCPSAEAIVLTYPVGSKLRLQQMIGRVIRGPKIGGTRASRVWGIEGSQMWLKKHLHQSDFRFSGWNVKKLG